MKYKFPSRKLKSRYSVCGVRCVGKMCIGCFRKVYWTKAKRKGMSEKMIIFFSKLHAKRKGVGRPVGSVSGTQEAGRVKEIKKRLGYLMDDD